VEARRDPKAFLGVGWAFPFGLAADGTAATARYEEDVEQAIRIILGTNPGERVMRPDFGAGLEDFLFEPIAAGTLERIRRRVNDALVDFEPRIDVLRVEARPAGAPVDRVDIAIEYRVRSTNTLHNLVHPFYLDEGAKGGGAP
jgi:phage baseplate assembly protein W